MQSVFDKLVLSDVNDGANGKPLPINGRDFVDLRTASAPFAIEDAMVFVRQTELIEYSFHGQAEDRRLRLSWQTGLGPVVKNNRLDACLP